jgi:hypothetical protein
MPQDNFQPFHEAAGRTANEEGPAQRRRCVKGNAGSREKGLILAMALLGVALTGLGTNATTPHFTLAVLTTAQGAALLAGALVRVVRLLGTTERR